MMVMTDSQLQNPHPIQYQSLEWPWVEAVRMYSITRSGPLPLSSILWLLLIITITHWKWNKWRLRLWRSFTRCISGSHSFYHQTVKKVDAILALVQEVPEVPEATHQEEHQGHRSRSNLAEMDDWSHILLRSQV